ncbi:hypothetical protein FCH28_30420 [Streptomyces piniterrae]|uniref:Uncharacterized protein n=1 Tax=Streptomyces piniterrae TaxID=2571125 RepID=A0A4U0MUD5_9ACTN|nr:hypothetical protein FCH28_30420 [Streptomyces piniterrae]
MSPKFEWHDALGRQGWQWGSSHIGYESWLERDRLILLDAAPQATGISSQPFWLPWRDSRRRRRHTPAHSYARGRSSSRPKPPTGRKHKTTERIR